MAGITTFSAEDVVIPGYRRYGISMPTNTNSRIDKIRRNRANARLNGTCCRCAPHRGENASKPSRKGKAVK